MGGSRGGAEGGGTEAYGFVGVDVEVEKLLVGSHHGELHLAAAGGIAKSSASAVDRGKEGGESTGVKSGCLFACRGGKES